MRYDSILYKFGMKPSHGLVWVSKPGDAANDAEALALDEARKYKADAVYFRRFEKGDAVHSFPQVYIYERELSDEDLAEVHTKLWSSGAVPLFYVLTSTQLKIFNCTKSVKVKGRSAPVSEPLKAFALAGDVQAEAERQKYSAALLDNGTFWEEHPEILDVADSPYQKLLDGLLSAKKDLEKKYAPHRELSPSTINKLLIIGVLVRYLEEKEDEQGVKLLEIGRDLYGKFPGCRCFTDVMRQGHIIRFLEELDAKFNGNIFDLKEAERTELTKAKLDFVAAVFDADIDSQSKQYVLWKQYSFNHLPIELISGIYEAFLKREKGVVYTPPFLVNMLIDECMPLHQAEAFFKEEHFKVLDPACGSGIFLVAALKRMIQWKAILHYRATGEVAYPGIEVIQRIIRNNIFGIDIEEGATLISNFSLCIALCDKLSPMQIWHELRFDEKIATENIRTADFFAQYSDMLRRESYDLVIGNPPFNPPAGYSNQSYLQTIKSLYGVEPSMPLNDHNLALFFWDRAVHLRNDGGKICFILPSSAWLYNHNSIEYRRAFLQRFQVAKIFDFSGLSDKLFHQSTNVAVCAAIATDKPAEAPQHLWHIVVKRSKPAEERFYFELDHYDYHQVDYQMALDNPFIWKANLLGGGRLLRLVDYLRRLRSLGGYLEKMKARHGWVYGEGYIIRHDGTKAESELVEEGYTKADWITGKDTVETSRFTENEMMVSAEPETFFWRPRKQIKQIFAPPHILIKENLGQERIPMVFSEDYLCFKNEIIGIHAEPAQTEALRALYRDLQEYADIHRFFLLAASSRAGVSRSVFTLLKSDIMNLPYPEDPQDLQLGYGEAIIQDDVLKYYIKANLSSSSSPLNQPTSDEALEAYGEAFCRILNPIYEREGQKWFAAGSHAGAAAISYVFCYGRPQPDPLPGIFDGGLAGIEKMLYDTRQRNLRTARVLREYLHIEGYDVLMLIKPKAMRYWLRSIALRDADETFADLKRTGL